MFPELLMKLKVHILCKGSETSTFCNGRWPPMEVLQLAQMDAMQNE